MRTIRLLSGMLLIAVLAIAAGCMDSSSGKGDGSSVTEEPHIEFETTEYDFGKIPYLGEAKYEFEFKNTGNQPLVLRNVKSTCGCTVPEWPKEPLNPGETAKITVKYNTRITGNFSKGITVYSNAENPTIQLRIKGEVEKAAAG